MNWLTTFHQLFSHRAFLLRRVVRYTVAEGVYLLGNCAPRRIAATFWRIALALNPHHVPAALNRALALQSANDAAAWSAFEAALRAIENPQHTSASDLALTWVPGRWARRLAQRVMWHAAPSDYMMDIYDHWNQDSLVQLAQGHFAKQLAGHDWARARFALDVWDRTRPNLAASWAKAEVEFLAGNVTLAAQHAAPLVEQGRFVSPLDAIRWGERLSGCQSESFVSQDKLREESRSSEDKGCFEQGAPLHDKLDLAEACLRWADEWTPELPQVWALLGRLASMRGRRDEARRAWERTLALDPEDIDTFLALWSLNHQRGADCQPAGELAAPQKSAESHELPTLRLYVQAPESMRVGAEAQLVCVLEGARDSCEIHVLPPAGWGIVAIPRHQSVDATGRCVFTLRACRPQRIRGEACAKSERATEVALLYRDADLRRQRNPDDAGRLRRGLQRFQPPIDRLGTPLGIRGEAWQLNVVAVSVEAYVTVQIHIAVPDDQPGQVLVVSTEDHEIHEERGTLSLDDLHRLFVDKSKTAAERLHPLTQMVEVGSALAMLDWAAEHGEPWRRLRDEARAELVKSVAAGGDLQPHLHAFNDPRSPEFPYRISPHGWSPNLEFLLTAEERRRDFAKAFSPRERIPRVEQAVAQIENIGRMGDPDYRAVLWRTGQLELGSDAADRAWSVVALLRAGLLADSDIPKPLRAIEIAATHGKTDLRRFGPNRLSPWVGAVSNRRLNFSTFSEAFFAGIDEPFAPCRGGQILQLPVWGNLEGDYLTDADTLNRLVRRTFAQLRQKDGTLASGVHVFTLLTHDKFINARRGGDEFRLDADYGDWATIREHLDAWKREGATFVTARDGIEQMIDDSAWRLTPLLGEETFNADGTQVRYTLRLLGKGIPVSADYAHHLLVTIPPFLRARVSGVRVCQGDHTLPAEWNRADCFWVVVSRVDAAIRCYFDLDWPVDLRLEKSITARSNGAKSERQIRI